MAQYIQMFSIAFSPLSLMMYINSAMNPNFFTMYAKDLREMPWERKQNRSMQQGSQLRLNVLPRLQP